MRSSFLKYSAVAFIPALVIVIARIFVPDFLPGNIMPAAVLYSLTALAAASFITAGEKSGSSEMRNFFRDLQREKKELQEIILSIREPILVVDSSGSIVLANRAFKKLANVTEAEGKHFSDILGSSEFAGFLGEVISGEKSSTASLQINDGYYFISASYLDTGKEVSVLFQDITQLKNLEKIKRDFVSNVSHELKTPLTAIKGFTETLEGEIDEKGRHYLEIIIRHTERLINIVNDLLILSEMEEKDVLEISQFSIREMTADIIQMFRSEAQGKGLKIDAVIDSSLDLVMADRSKIEQLLINLTANAVKYTEQGLITIKVGSEEKDLVISVSDTGIGLEEKHIPRIFERFYRVSKSRSRQRGGTGLGLAIVKHIALQHKGTVCVESIPGRGTVFSVRLPYAVSDETTELF